MNRQVLAVTGFIDTHIHGAEDVIIAVDWATRNTAIFEARLDTIAGIAIIAIGIAFTWNDGVTPDLSIADMILGTLVVRRH